MKLSKERDILETQRSSVETGPSMPRSGMVMQLLAGSKIIEVDQSLKEDPMSETFSSLLWSPPF